MAKTLLHPDEHIKKRFYNRRGYPRVPYKVPLRYSVCSHNKIHDIQDAMTENVSQSGMLLFSPAVPPISSLILFDVDVDFLAQCIDIERLFITEHKSLLAKVVHVNRDKKKGIYSVGISFIKVSDKKRSDVKEALKNMPGA